MRKICSICNIEKDIDEFYSQKKKPKTKEAYIYYNPECKECRKEKSNQYKINNRDEYLLSMKKTNNKPERKKFNRENSKIRRESGKHKAWMLDNKEKTNGYTKNYSDKKHKISTKEWDACRLYFNYRCAYCNKTYEQNLDESKQDLHKEHVDHKGSDGLENCVPACRSCNVRKHNFDFDDWYNEDNIIFDYERKQKIFSWIEADYKLYKKI